MMMERLFMGLSLLQLCSGQGWHHAQGRPPPVYNIGELPQQQYPQNGQNVFLGPESYPPPPVQHPSVLSLPEYPAHLQHPQPRPNSPWTAHLQPQQRGFASEQEAYAYQRQNYAAQQQQQYVQGAPQGNVQHFNARFAAPNSQPIQGQQAQVLPHPQGALSAGQNFIPFPQRPQNNYAFQYRNPTQGLAQNQAQNGPLPFQGQQANPGQPIQYQGQYQQPKSSQFGRFATQQNAGANLQSGLPQGLPSQHGSRVDFGKGNSGQNLVDVAKSPTIIGSSNPNFVSSNSHSIEKPWIGSGSSRLHSEHDGYPEDFQFVVTRAPDTPKFPDLQKIGEKLSLNNQAEGKVSEIDSAFDVEETGVAKEFSVEAGNAEPEPEPEGAVKISAVDIGVEAEGSNYELSPEDLKDCEWSEFGDWGECSATCGYAMMSRERKVQKGGPLCGDERNLIETKRCADIPICAPKIRIPKLPVPSKKSGDFMQVRLVSKKGSCNAQNCRARNITEGRPEVFMEGKWGTICDDSLTKMAGKVICNQLGLNARFGSESVVCGKGCKGAGDGPVHLSHLNCTGSEDHLMACQHASSAAASMCSHSEDIGVICENFNVRLVSGSRRCEKGECYSEGIRTGRPEVFFDGQWGPICDTNTEDMVASVICRQLGLKKEWGGEEQRVCHGGCRGEGSGIMHMDRVRCEGSERTVSDCQHSGVGPTECPSKHALGIIC